MPPDQEGDRRDVCRFASRCYGTLAQTFWVFREISDSCKSSLELRNEGPGKKKQTQNKTQLERIPSPAANHPYGFVSKYVLEPPERVFSCWCPSESITRLATVIEQLGPPSKSMLHTGPLHVRLQHHPTKRKLLCGNGNTMIFMQPANGRFCHATTKQFSI